MTSTDVLNKNAVVMDKSYKKYLVIFLCVAFGLCWGVAALFIVFSDVFTPIFGELTMSNPLVITILCSPSISGLLVYFLMGRGRGVLSILKKVVPRKEDLFWFPILLAVVALFYITMHYGSIILGVGVPERSLPVSRWFIEALKNLYEVGNVFGWFGFLLPYLQTRMKKDGKINVTIKAGLLTGFFFGLFIMPGYIVSSFETASMYPYYLVQIMIYCVFIAYVLNATKGNLLVYIFSFWLLGSGSKLELYFFNLPVQIMQIVYFLILSIVIHILVKNNKVKHELQTLPEYVGL